MFFHVCFHLHELCMYKRVGAWEWVSMCSVCVFVSMSVGMWVHSHVWCGTQARCVEHFLPSSVPLYSQNYKRLEGGSEGGRCRKVEGGAWGRSTNTHQSLNKHLKTTPGKPPWEIMHVILHLLLHTLKLTELMTILSVWELRQPCMPNNTWIDMSYNFLYYSGTILSHD